MTRPEARCPVAPQCKFTDGPTQCGARSSHLLVDPDGKALPGGYYCERHGRRIVDDYAAKVSETWTLEPLKVGVPEPEETDKL